MADWQSIKTEYITTDTSYRKLAQKYGINHAVIGQKAKAENWVELRRQHLDKTQTKTLNAISNKQADRAAKLIGVSDLLLDKVKALLEADEELLVDTSVMKDVSIVLKNLKEIQMIKSDADIKEQEARIDKLRKEAMVEKQNNEVKVTIQGELEEYSQ